MPEAKRGAEAYLEKWLWDSYTASDAVLYLLKSYLKGIWVGGLTHSAALVSLAAKLPATVFNGAVAIIFAPVLYTAIRAALKKSHLEV